MKRIIQLLLLTIVVSSCQSEENRIQTSVNIEIEDYDFISTSILADTTLNSIGIVAVGDYDYVYSKNTNTILATYYMVETTDNISELILIGVLTLVVILLIILIP